MTLVTAISENGLVEAVLVEKKRATKGKGKKSINAKKGRAAKGGKKAENQEEEQQKKVGRGTNTADFIAFLKLVLDKLESQGIENQFLIFDNAPIHTSADIVELVRGRKHEPVLLPKYSPMINPIEEYFSKVKTLFRRDRLTNEPVKSLKERLGEAMASVEPDNYHKWIKHSTEFFPRFIAKEDGL